MAALTFEKIDSVTLAKAVPLERAPAAATVRA